MKSQPIGIYDSGIGGLTVLRALRRALPHENFIYFADTANLPYGNKTQEQIIDFSRQIVHWFKNKCQVKLAVAACHTSSALALDSLEKEIHFPLVGTIQPLISTLVQSTHHQRIALIATEASAKRKTHEAIFQNAGYKGSIYTIGCPDFVPLIEQGQFETEALKRAASTYLHTLKDFNPDTLIFGCTHYPFIRPLIESLLPATLHYIDPADMIAKDVTTHLHAANLHNDRSTYGSVQFVCSSDPDNFQEKIGRLMGHGFGEVQCIDLSHKSRGILKARI